MDTKLILGRQVLIELLGIPTILEEHITTQITIFQNEFHDHFW